MRPLPGQRYAPAGERFLSNMKKNMVFNNAKWIVVCKVIQSLIQLIIGMLTARYLGPTNYGLINYAKSVVAFVGPFTQLGLNATLVRELVEAPEKEGEIIGTSLIMGLVSSGCCIAAVTCFVSIANRGDVETILVCVLYSFSLLFQAIELIQYWFHSKLQSKFPSIIMLCAYIVVSVYKVFLLVSGKSVYWFAIVYSIEYGLIGLSLLVIFHMQSDQKLLFSFSLAKKLFARSRYYILSSLMVTVFQNTDHVMLKIMSSDTENGIYSAAITCAAVFQFVYAAIIDSMRPVILSGKRAGHSDYEYNISRLYCIVIYLALLQGIGFVVFAKPIVWVLFGNEYMDAVPVLQILVWYIAFSQMGRVRNVWILAEEKQEVLWKINLAGALANVAMNGLLIPRWGAAGAAFASFITQFFANFVIGFILKPLRDNNRILLSALNPLAFLDSLKLVKKRD